MAFSFATFICRQTTKIKIRVVEKEWQAICPTSFTREWRKLLPYLSFQNNSTGELNLGYRLVTTISRFF